MKLNEKEKYALDYYRSLDTKKVSLDIELENDILHSIREIAKENDISVSEYCEMALGMVITSIRKQEEIDKNEFENIIDIFDMYNIEELLETEKKYLIINPNGKHLVMIPKKEADELQIVAEHMKDISVK